MLPFLNKGRGPQSIPNIHPTHRIPSSESEISCSLGEDTKDVEIQTLKSGFGTLSLTGPILHSPFFNLARNLQEKKKKPSKNHTRRKKMKASVTRKDKEREAKRSGIGKQPYLPFNRMFKKIYFIYMELDPRWRIKFSKQVLFQKPLGPHSCPKISLQNCAT